MLLDGTQRAVPLQYQAMTYQVLARKLRPADFSALVGQDHVVQALTHALDNDRLHHAYLFTGTRGVGKTTIARILARCLNCEQGVSSTPCGSCDACTAISEGRFVDLIEMDGASQNKVENVHDLQDGAQYMPNTGRFKVYLIDEVHMLSKSAFNALLKILEEPPAHVKFLLATTEVNKLPITILSRCLQFQLKNMSVDSISSYLAEALSAEGIEFDTGALRIIGTAASGSMRDALSVTDQAISFGAGKLEESQVARMLGVSGRDEISALLTALAAADAEQVLTCSQELSDRGVDFAAVLADLLRAFHDIAVAQILPGSASQGAESADDKTGKGQATDLITDSLGVRYANSFEPDVVQLFYQIVLRSHHDLAMSPDPQIGFEMALLRMLAFAPEDLKQSVPPLTSPSSAASNSASDAEGNTSESDAQSEPEPTTATPQRVNALVAHKQKQKQVDQTPLPRASDSFWYNLQEKLEAQGVVSMIMRNCILQRRETLTSKGDTSTDTSTDIGKSGATERWYLQLDPAHDGMLSDRHPTQIASLVSAAVDSRVDIDLSVAEPVWETPFMQLTRERKERQDAAVSLMRESEMTKSLSEIFGAQLDEESVRPGTDLQLQEQSGEQS